MKSRVKQIIVGAAGILALACVDLSAPKGSPSSISQVQLPALFVVRGDLLRDSLGNPATPEVIAYDGAGNVVTGYTPSFFVSDSNPVISINASGQIAAGNRFGTARLLGQIGSVQTAPTTVYVTVAPTTLRRPTTTPDTLKLVFSQDSASSIAFYDLAVAVRGGVPSPDTAVGGAFVSYAIVSAPLASRNGSPVAFIGDQSNNRSLLDTTDASGTASRRLVVNGYLLTDNALASGQKIDSVIVEARMKYRGANVAGSPLRFVVKLKGGFGR